MILPPSTTLLLLLLPYYYYYYPTTTTTLLPGAPRIPPCAKPSEYPVPPPTPSTEDQRYSIRSLARHTGITAADYYPAGSR